MKISIAVLTALIAISLSGCVQVDLGQASRDWAEVGKSWADAYKEGQAPQDVQQQPAQVPAAP